MKNARKEELNGKWKKVATKAVSDDKFKAKQVADPLGMMEGFELALPEEVEVLRGHGNTITLIEPKGASEHLSSEVKWWRVRLAVIQEFGEDEDRHREHGTAGPQGAEDDDA